MRRLFWVAVGATAGVVAVRKVQKAARAYSPSGLASRAVGVGESFRVFTDQVRANMADREAELREALGMEQAGDQPLSPGAADHLTRHPSGTEPYEPQRRSRA
jgi:hypothetical protein